MMHNISVRVGAFLFAVVAILPSLPQEALSGETWIVSTRSLTLGKRERVVGFEVSVVSGGVVALPSVPMGWNITIDNDPSWRTSIRGSAVVGAAAIDPNFFRDFIVIKKHDLQGVKFDIEVEVVVTEDFESERRIRLRMRELVLRRK